jgi:histidyl-tRNA synthetase
MSKPKLTGARRPRGLEDRTPAAINATRDMLETIRQVYERYGFEPVETPLIEFTDALGKFLPDQDRPNAGVFSFQDDDEQWLSLRYDLTAPLARYVAENFDKLPKPYRSYRVGPVFRNEKPGPGRFRQFMQFDADTVGASSVAADAENCMMFADAMEALGLYEEQPDGTRKRFYVVKVNNRKVLDGVMEAIGIGGEEHAAMRLTVLRAIDKMDKFPVEEIIKLLTSGRWDGGEEGRGDFTKGAGLSSDQANAIIQYCSPKNFYIWPAGEAGRDMIGQKSQLLRDIYDNPTYQSGVGELKEIASQFIATGYGPQPDGSQRIRIDPSVVRGLEYYTGPVYEVELTFDVPGDDGKPVRFGSVGGGGRYDGLIGRFRAEDVPATGISIGVSRLQAALTHLGKLKSEPPAGPVVVTVMDKTRIAEYQQMVSELRNAGIKSELYLGDASSFGPQLKYCDRRNSPLAIIQGGDELARGEVQIKDLKKGAALAASAKTITDRDEFQRLRAEAQYAVPREGLVEAVRKALGV